ncbi:H-type small acid-soluble spore protein [Alkalibacillus haloalkaliphilus]|uniref:H-type small acid-soluble spore protein n=1 Tax=Alkalibacillus haloalkaliphilus TaxID=94136 RepID=UPI0002F317D1|nr:H-type small acid-soluble spore protein [Alkalibacillus haloalkaliphilus]
MNLMRAKEIKDDPNMKNVVYKGKYVYIDEVNDDKQKAIIHYLKESGTKFEVDVTKLEEE